MLLKRSRHFIGSKTFGDEQYGAQKEFYIISPHEISCTPPFTVETVGRFNKTSTYFKFEPLH